MFERYTESARRVIFFSHYMANQSGSAEIEVEHLLLGLLRADMGLSRRFLGSPWAAEDCWRESQPKMGAKATEPNNLPLSTDAKRALLFAAKEADRISSRKICTEHLLLGLLQIEMCSAKAFLCARGLQLAATREELHRVPHDDSITEKFVRETTSLPQDVAESQTRLRLIVDKVHQAIEAHEFVKARTYADEERTERESLRLLCEKHGLAGWMFV